MFTIVFGKTSFWSYLIAFSVLIAAVFWHHEVIEEQNPSVGNNFRSFIIGIRAGISLLCVDWTVRRQMLFKKGSYHLLVFALFFWILPWPNLQEQVRIHFSARNRIFLARDTCGN